MNHSGIQRDVPMFSQTTKRQLPYIGFLGNLFLRASHKNAVCSNFLSWIHKNAENILTENGISAPTTPTNYELKTWSAISDPSVRSCPCWVFLLWRLVFQILLICCRYVFFCTTCIIFKHRLQAMLAWFIPELDKNWVKKASKVQRKRKIF